MTSGRDTPPRRGAGLRPWVERAWREEGVPGEILLRPLASIYAVVTSVARWRAGRSREAIAGVRVVAVGGLAVGGAGKTSLARWAALTAHAAGLAPALLLRGHGGNAAHLSPQALPLPRPGDAAAVRWFGDEAMAHRAALPPDVPVVAGQDRFAAARLAAAAGARTMILDDGWEQGALAWDSLWVTLDPLRPLANRRSLPAGPLRRPPSNLKEANVLVAIAETQDEASSEELATVVRRYAPGKAVVRFRRRLRRLAGPGDASGPEDLASLGSVLLVSSVGSPERLERFLSGERVAVAEHLAFPDHAPWNPVLIQDRAAAAAARGVRTLLVTDKDAARARLLPALPLDLQVLSTRLEPLDDPGPLLRDLGVPVGATPWNAPRGPMAGPPAIG